jgi:hypothetical protein
MGSPAVPAHHWRHDYQRHTSEDGERCRLPGRAQLLATTASRRAVRAWWNLLRDQLRSLTGAATAFAVMSALWQSPVRNLGREQAQGPSFPTGPPTTPPSLPSCGWLHPTPSSNCATARLAAATTASPDVECRPTRPVRADPPPKTIGTTTITGTPTINPAEKASDGSGSGPTDDERAVADGTDAFVRARSVLGPPTPAALRCSLHDHETGIQHLWSRPALSRERVIRRVCQLGWLGGARRRVPRGC